MSTSASLPAGAAITSINGVRCTAIPRSASSVSTAAKSTSTTSIPPSTSTSFSSSSSSPSTTSTSTSTTQTQAAISISTTATQATAKAVSAGEPAAAASSTSTSTSISISSSSSSSIIAISTLATPPPLPPPIASIPNAISSPSTEPQTPSTDPNTATTSASPASKGTTPTESSSTSLAIAQSEFSPSPSTSTHDPVTHLPDASHTSTAGAAVASHSTSSGEDSTSSGISSNPPLAVGPIIGGILGGIGFLALIALLIWFLRRRQKAKRGSLLTPLTTGTRENFYEIDTDSVGPTSKGRRIQAQFRGAIASLGVGLAGVGAALKSRSNAKNDRPTVNLNRGNSQFFEGPIPTHSRNNSTASAHSLRFAAKNRVEDYWGGVAAKFRRTLRMKPKEEHDPFAIARGMSEKQARQNTPPDFSRLLDTDNHDLSLSAERRRASSLSSNFGSKPRIGSLGLDFGIPEDPFADPTPGLAGPWQPPNKDANANPNPFADPISRPDPAVPKSNTYISEIRRSRGQSVDSTRMGNNQKSAYGPAAYRTPSIGVVSRYPSSMAPSTDSYRDTVYSTISNNPRKLAGRSDPFDLERPELWFSSSMPKPSTPALPERDSELYPDPLMAARGAAVQAPKIHRVTSDDSRIQSQGTYQSNYSSGVSSTGISSMDDWGDPGPDLGPGSLEKQGFYGNGANGNINKSWDLRRNQDNVSPMSIESYPSSTGGVGKAR
ncbi:hypothetical protein ACMFMF_008309 [Clarireedia jacksonii]